MEPYSLPHGARGMEGDEFAIEFRGDKVVFIARSAGTGEHYTLQAGLKSGVIDLHKTQPNTEAGDPHRTLFALRRDGLPGILEQFEPMVPLRDSRGQASIELSYFVSAAFGRDKSVRHSRCRRSKPTVLCALPFGQDSLPLGTNLSSMHHAGLCRITKNTSHYDPRPPSSSEQKT